MQLKSFITGTLAGIVLTVSVFQLLGQSDQRTDSTPSNLPVVDSAAKAVENFDTDPPVTAPQEVSATQDIGEVGLAVEGIENRGTSNNVIIQPSVQTADRPSQIPVTDSHKMLLEQYSDADPEATAPSNNRRELENEPRDHDWSYFMEQSIGQYLASHPEIVYFDIAGIECRSTMCEIQSFGVDENAGPRWGLIVHDLRNQPWNDFGQTGSSSSTIEGRLVIVTHLRRVSEEE